MLRIKINKDIEEYSEGMFIGLNIKEIGNFLIMAVVSVILVYLWSRIVPIIAALYLSAPIIMVIALIGRKTGNMSMGELIKFIPVYMELKKGIEFSSTERPENKMICMDENNSVKNNNVQGEIINEKKNKHKE